MKSLAYSRKTSYLRNQEKKVFAGSPDAPASTLKKIAASSDGMPLPEFVFYVQKQQRTQSILA